MFLKTVELIIFVEKISLSFKKGVYYSGGVLKRGIFQEAYIMKLVEW
jgi:hypothetical protein